MSNEAEYGESISRSTTAVEQGDPDMHGSAGTIHKSGGALLFAEEEYGRDDQVAGDSGQQVQRGREGTMHRVLVTGCVFPLICVAVFSAGCSESAVTAKTETPPRSAPAHPVSQATTYVYECTDGSTFVTRIEGETAWLFLPTETVSLPLVSSGSGAKYTDDEITFWSKGAEATLEVGKGARRDCWNNRAEAIWEDAKFRGANFRAVGNEPGWNLEISAGGEIVYVGDYGQIRYRFPTPVPIEDRDARRTTYRVEEADHEIVIVLEGRRCRDTMSGEAFETTVTVVLDGKEFSGCGRALH